MEQNAKCFVVDGRVRRAHLTFKGSVTGAMNEGDREPRFQRRIRLGEGRNPNSVVSYARFTVTNEKLEF